MIVIPEWLVFVIIVLVLSHPKSRAWINEAVDAALKPFMPLIAVVVVVALFALIALIPAAVLYFFGAVDAAWTAGMVAIGLAALVGIASAVEMWRDAHPLPTSRKRHAQGGRDVGRRGRLDGEDTSGRTAAGAVSV